MFYWKAEHFKQFQSQGSNDRALKTLLSIGKALLNIFRVVSLRQHAWILWYKIALSRAIDSGFSIQHAALRFYASSFHCAKWLNLDPICLATQGNTRTQNFIDFVVIAIWSLWLMVHVRPTAATYFIKLSLNLSLPHITFSLANSSSIIFHPKL